MESFKCDECHNHICVVQSNRVKIEELTCICDAEISHWKGQGISNIPDLPELMTLQEAVTKSNAGDHLKAKDEENGDWDIIKEEYGKFTCSRTKNIVDLDCSLFLLKWQIIPAEPKVLTAEEWLFDTYGDAGPNKHIDFFTRNVAIGAFQKGEKNQWLNHKELREAVEKFFKENKVAYGMNDILEAFENIKPLKAE